MDATEKQQLMAHSYVILMANSILMYDHMVTLTEEIAFIWRRPKALSAMSFLVNRYVAMFGNIYGLFVDFMPISNELFEIHAIQTAVHFSSTIHRLRKWLLTWITIICLALAGGACAGSFGHYTKNETTTPGGHCFELYTAEAYVIIFAILYARFGLAWLAIFAFELLIFVLTVHRTCKTRGLLRLRLVTRRNILDLILQDGAMYFGTMTLCNIPNIMMYYSRSGDLRGSLGLATFTSCMSVTLMSRLMLNLHKSIDCGIFSTPTRDEYHNLAVLTTGINVQSGVA
ncbi:hypothetical protein EDB19DRAFT_2027506 [Suillus lakei]|nr:hypothetical protein EDB19DRAFT_2027506 [Suillus lakei]